MTAVGSLVLSLDGECMVLPPQHCPQGHRLGPDRVLLAGYLRSQAIVELVAANSDGKTPSDITDFVSRAVPQEMAYIQALNAYASQFGGQQVPQT